jgi:lipoprotein-releasing system ATP-binding protein
MNEERAEVLALRGVERAFVQGGEKIEVLKGIDLDIAAGEAVALVGPSGAGKSTLLHIAGLLERADRGEIRIAGENCAALDDARRTRLRRRAIGFVYQFHHLLPELSALENVVLAQMINGRSKHEAAAHARKLLEALGLGLRLSHRPARLSGGEQQRVALARAVINGPSLLLADEPTGDLDGQTAKAVMAELLQLVRTGRMGALIATHNTELAQSLDRTVFLSDGRLIPA